jgi:phosphoribosylformylglycinamidine (FGAM) synthase PurS component
MNHKTKMNRSREVRAKCLGLLAAVTGTLAVATSSVAETGFGSGACDLQIVDQTPARSLGYDPLSRDPYIQSLSYRIRNVGLRACAGRLRLTPIGGQGMLSNSRGDTMDFVLLDRRSGGRTLWDSRRLDGQESGLVLKPGETFIFEPKLVLPSGQDGVSGDYAARLDIEFTSSDAATLPDRYDFNVNMRVRANVQANFTGVDRSAVNGRWSFVNLGELTTGKTRRLGLQLRSNADVQATISSLNGGTLRNPFIEEASVDYSLSIGGRDLTLESATEMTLPADLSRGGRTSPVVIGIGDVSNKPAGLYGDVIRVRISAL